MCDRLQRENNQLHERLDKIYSEGQVDPTVEGRLRDVIKMAYDRLGVMVPTRDMGSQALIQLIAFEIEKIVDKK